MIDYRRCNTIDITELISLMRETNTPVAGIKSTSIYKALISDALNNKNVLIAVACQERSILGFVVAIRDWRRYWINFGFRYPSITMQVMTNKIKHIISTTNQTITQSNVEINDLSEWIAKIPLNKSWEESNSKIAKVVYIAVKKSARNKDIGKNLYKVFFSILKESGVVRVDGMVSPNNIAAIKMDYDVGFEIEKYGKLLFVSKDLSE